jgi:hypothetical protein
MSLHRITVSLHCWPARRPERQAPGRMRSLLPDTPLPADRIELLDLALDGDSLRDVEAFDQQLSEGLKDVARRVLAIRTHALDGLRQQGYTTRLEISIAAEPSGLEIDLPLELIAAASQRGLGIRVSHDQVVMVDEESVGDADEAGEAFEAEKAVSSKP